MKAKLVILVLSWIGFMASLASLYNYLNSVNTGYCGVGEDSCSFLYTVPEAEMLGIHFSIMAPIYFAILSLATTLLYRGVWKQATLVLAVLLTMGTAIVPILVYIEYTYSTLCIYCTVMHVSILLSYAVLLARWGSLREDAG